MALQVATKQPQAAPGRRIALTTRIDKAQEVVLTGDFSAWTTKGIRMLRSPNGEWRATLDLAPGEYQYRLLVDGQWRDHAEATRRVANPFGTQNCVLTVT